MAKFRVSEFQRVILGSGGQRTVLITGVSKGLGKALAVQMAAQGQIVIGCSRSQDKLSALEAQLRTTVYEKEPLNANNDKHLFMTVDVRSNSSVQELARALMEKDIVPDIIVNNAGTINKNNKMWEVPEEEFDAVIDTNLKGTANMMRHFIPMMIESEREYGVIEPIIVNISSEWGRSTAPHVAPYCASKWAVEGLTRSVAEELPSELVAVVALNPGVINTDMLESCFGAEEASLYPQPEAWAERAAAMILNLRARDNGSSLNVYY